MTIQQLALAILDEFSGIHKNSLTQSERKLIRRAITALEENGTPVDTGWNEHGEFQWNTRHKEITPQ